MMNACYEKPVFLTDTIPATDNHFESYFDTRYCISGDLDLMEVFDSWNLSPLASGCFMWNLRKNLHLAVCTWNSGDEFKK
jgi:hypothetical protein